MGILSLNSAILYCVSMYIHCHLEKSQDIAQISVFPPVPAVVEDGAFAFFAVLLLQERDLVADAELDVFCDMQVSLGACLEIDVVPHTALHSEADVMERFIAACSIVLVEERTLAIAIYRMVAIVIMT